MISIDLNTLISIIAIVVAVWLGILQLKYKNLTFEVVSRTPLVSKDQSFKENVIITVNDKQVDNVDLVVVRITNRGNQPITSKDYERPLCLVAGPKSKILTIEIHDRKPSDIEIGATISNDYDRVFFTPTLFNRKDFISIKMLISNYDFIKLEGRVTGVKDFKPPLMATVMPIALMIGGLLISISSLIFIGFNWQNKSVWVRLTSALGPMFGGIIIAAGVETMKTVARKIKL